MLVRDENENMKREIQNKVTELSRKLKVYESHLELAQHLDAGFRGNHGWVGCWHDLNKTGELGKHQELMKQRVIKTLKKKIFNIQKELDEL